MTAPLLTTTSSVKMGKTAAGAVWLNSDRLSPYDYWQFWRNTENADVVRFLKLFTDLPMAEIKILEKAEGAELNSVKERLANEATTLVHGADAAKHAETTAKQTFGPGEAAEGLPMFELNHAERVHGIALVDLLVCTELVSSKGEARRAISGRGIRVNGEVIEDLDRIVSS